MEKNLFRVLVFPSCNEPGLEIIHALTKSNKVVLFGGSSGDTAIDPSKNILRYHLKIPSLYDRKFRGKFIEILKRHKINYVFPTVDALVAEFSTWKVKGVTFLVTDTISAKLAMSKSALYKRLAGIIPVPQLYSDRKEISYPAFAKFDGFAGAKGAFVVRNAVDLAKAERDKMIVCQYLEGDEYTVDAVSDLGGKLLFHNARKRSKIGRSIALGTKSVKRRDISKYMHKIARELKIRGPWFAQFKSDGKGQLILLEVNCRMGGSSTLTRLSGVNIPLLSLFLFAKYDVQVAKVSQALEINRALTNYTDPLKLKAVFWDLDDTLIRKDGKTDPDSIACLYDLYNRGTRQILISRKPDVRALSVKYKLPPIFRDIQCSSDKVKTIRNYLRQNNLPAPAVAVINDSNIENRALQKAFPKMLIVTPECLERLGREKIK
ncbi:hypothetical protein A2154_00030 [Candidatus Gottesmanbacteria bacterium RBG_16_43_7]|uniref:ATP-grasp domain-containing protein n=1 Tax=Candidatus Gottesmanbacteria bacterium RBG_16_43_7 TaxID=1798373 RepID=A0A1F5ZC90_9BACT|nr:MAG: hypothetical protein A2154_00030 [Candidatus Gottesmanbacteria bacterium RBG_16_43_7]